MKPAVFLFFTLSQFAFAQNPLPTEKLNSRIHQQQGQLFSVRLEQGKPLKIFVVGREQAKFNFKDMKLTVKSISPYKTETLAVNQQGEYFVVPQNDNKKSATALDVTVSVKDQTETLRFKLNTLD
jgi:hypothetical protein